MIRLGCKGGRPNASPRHNSLDKIRHDASEPG